MNRVTSLAAALGLLIGGASVTPALAGTDAPDSGCPVSLSALRIALNKAVADVTSGFNNQMWAVVVNRGGVVCSVAFSGDNVFDQWLLSRQIAEAKAFTANGLSLDNAPLSTAQLYPLVQPGGILFGLAEGNPLDTTTAYKGSTKQFGTPSDPMIGHRVGGTITFGGGLGLYQGKTKAVGGLGLSGDTSCTDDEIARKVRENLNLVPSKPDTIKFGSGKGEHPSCG